jgi:hypothetical protein
MATRNIVTGILLMFFAHLGAASASAQMCFRGKPAPECRVFWITEFGGAYAWGNTGDHGWGFVEAGLMYNVGKRYAIGGTYFVYGGFSGSGSEVFTGLNLRLRRWINRDISFNVSGGMSLFNGEEFPDFTSHIDLNYKDYVAPFLGFAVIQGGSLDGTNWHAGLRFGSYPGVIGISVLVLAAAVAVAASGGP